MPVVTHAPSHGLLGVFYSRLGKQLAGLTFLAVLAGLGWLAVTVYHHGFTSVDKVTLRVRTIGTQLNLGADVKLRGLIVGEVRDIAIRDGAADLTLAIDPSDMHLIPADVQARIVPKTLFGEKYVNLVIPADASRQRLAAGDVIGEDRSSTAIETSQVLDDLAPLLHAVQPAKLNATLTALAQALDGRGQKLGEALTAADDYLRGINPQLPNLVHDIAAGADTADSYTAAVDDLVRAGRNAGVTADTLVTQAGPLGDLLRSTTEVAGTATRVLQDNGDRLIALTTTYQPLLELLAKYSPEIPCTFSAAVTSTQRLNDPFHGGKLHARIFLVPSRGRYVPGQDDPRIIHIKDAGPYCPVTPNGPGGVPNPPIPPEAQFLLGKPQPLSIIGPGVVGLPGPSTNTNPPPTSSSAAPPAVTATVPTLVGLLIGALLPGGGS